MLRILHFMKEKIKKIGKFIERHLSKLTILQPKKNNQERIQSIKLIQEENTKNTILFSYRDLLVEKGRLRRKAKREARRKKKRKDQRKKGTRFAFIKTMLCDGLQREPC